MLRYLADPVMLMVAAVLVVFCFGILGRYAVGRSQEPKRPRLTCRKGNPSPEEKVPFWRVR